MLLQPAEAARNRAVPSAGHNPFTHKWDVSALLQGRAMQAPRGATPENTSNARSVQSISRTMRNLVPLDITFRALYAHTLQRKVKKSQYDGAGPLRVALGSLRRDRALGRGFGLVMHLARWSSVVLEILDPLRAAVPAQRDTFGMGRTRAATAYAVKGRHDGMRDDTGETPCHARWRARRGDRASTRTL